MSGNLDVAWFDPDGNQITTLQWAERFEDLDGRTLHATAVTMPDNVVARVLTIWYGMVVPGSCCQRLFTTAVRYGAGMYHTVAVHDSKAEAEHGHAAIAAMLTAGTRPPLRHAEGC